MQAVDFFRRRRRSPVRTVLRDTLPLPVEERRPERARIDRERLADVVEGEWPFVVDRADPALGLLREEAGIRARVPQMLLEAANAVLQDREHEGLPARR